MMSAIYVNVVLDKTPNAEVTYPWSSYMLGSLTGLVALAVYTDFAFQMEMFFLPLLIFSALHLVCSIAIVFVFAFMDLEDPNQVVIFLHGLLDAQTQMFALFLTPLRIADKYRLT
jgi:hypothetical protein